MKLLFLLCVTGPTHPIVLLFSHFFKFFYFACSKLDGCRVILCFQLSNGIMKNTITLKRTLQSVEVGQALILKRGYLWSCGKKTTQTPMSSLLLASRAIQQRGRHFSWNDGEQRFPVTNGHC